MIEVEAYRVLAERAALGRPIRAVETPDEWYLKAGLVPGDLEVLVGYELTRRADAASSSSWPRTVLIERPGPSSACASA